jgi:lipoprotein-releasing system permease protein
MVAIYQFTHVPAHITAGEVAWIGGYAIFMATLAGFIAAWRAAKLKPVEALRSE